MREMGKPVLTPRMIEENGWAIGAPCEQCGVFSSFQGNPFRRLPPDFDLGEALRLGRLTCSECRTPRRMLTVKKWVPNLWRQVMEVRLAVEVERFKD